MEDPNRIYSPRAQKSNPECEVSHKIRADEMPPVVAIEFENGVKDQFNCHDLKVEDIARKIKDISRFYGNESQFEGEPVSTWRS